MLMVAIWLEEGGIGDSRWVWEFGRFCVWFEIWVTVVWCGDASNRSVFALIPKLMQDNQNKTETTIK